MTQLVIALMLFRLGIIFVLFILSAVKPKKIEGYWRGGVSVIIPAYNEVENIQATIESVLQTTRKKIEIIVIDDGSTDGTQVVVEKIQQKHPGKVLLYNQVNQGKAAALNHGIRRARYGVVVAMDGDTIFTPDTIAHLVRPFGNRKVSAVAGKVCVTESANLYSKFQHLEYVISQNIDKAAFNYLNAVSVVPGPNGAWRKSVVLEHGGFKNDTLVEDQEMTFAILASGQRVVYEPRALAFTETPFRLTDFIRQRLRWIFGTLQCVIKYRGQILKPHANTLGSVVIPNVMIYTLFLPLLYPVMDILFLSWLAFSFFDQLGFVLMLFLLIDLIYALLGFYQEKHQRKLLFWLPLQRVFYRVVIYYVVLKSVLKALEGSEMFWNKVLKRGDAATQHLSLQEVFAATEPEML